MYSSKLLDNCVDLGPRKYRTIYLGTDGESVDCQLLIVIVGKK